MKRIPIFLLVLFLPSLVSAAGFNNDLYFGLRNNADVILLQEFLRDQGAYRGPITGNFFSLTREVVISFQKRENIEPSTGYFGPKTRARANEILSRDVILPPPVTAPVTAESLIAKIATLTAQLKLLKEKLAEEQTVATPPAVIEQAPITPAQPPLVEEVSIKTEKTFSFPEVEQTPFKLGEFKVKNTTKNDVLFSNINADIIDDMDSTFNRGQKIYIFLREGTEPIGPLISKTEFTFVSATSSTFINFGRPFTKPVALPFAVLLKIGEEKLMSIWFEQFKYVKSGTLEIKSTQTVTTDSSISSAGNFDFVLTRKPPL